jgi:hypothetical protein
VFDNRALRRIFGHRKEAGGGGNRRKEKTISLLKSFTIYAVTVILLA